MRLPPYGAPLAERMRFHNPPLHGVVCVGLHSWQRAKTWNTSPADTVAMVLPPDAAPDDYQWPVEHLPVVIDADTGPPLDLIHALALQLLTCGSVAVTLVSFTNSHPFTRFVWSHKQ